MVLMTQCLSKILYRQALDGLILEYTVPWTIGTAIDVIVEYAHVFVVNTGVFIHLVQVIKIDGPNNELQTATIMGRKRPERHVQMSHG